MVAFIAGCAQVTDAPIPPGYADLVSGARTSLANNMDGILRPGLAFRGIRCFANGGLVVVFREVGGANDGRAAWTIRGRGGADQGGDPSSWGGGFGADSMAEEIAFNFPGVPQVACPPR